MRATSEDLGCTAAGRPVTARSSPPPGTHPGPLPALSSAAASWGVSRSLRERTPESPEVVRRPARLPHCVPGLSEASGSRGREPGFECSGLGRGAAPGRRKAEPLAGIPAPLSSSGSAPVVAGEACGGRLRPPEAA